MRAFDNMDYEYNQKEKLEQKRKDQYAINFAIWVYNLKLELIDKNSIQQLLEIYKKETNAKH
jgi:hypothetical protein